MRKRLDLIVLVLATVAVGLVVSTRVFGGGGHIIPAMFKDKPTALDEAIAEGEASGKPVLAVVSATWCPPCKAFKAGALSDAAVEAWVSANAVPVLIDADENPSDAGRLQTQYLPSVYLVRNGEVVASRSGNVSAGEFLDWLRTNAGSPAAEPTPEPTAEPTPAPTPAPEPTDAP